VYPYPFDAMQTSKCYHQNLFNELSIDMYVV